MLRRSSYPFTFILLLLMVVAVGFTGCIDALNFNGRGEEATAPAAVAVDSATTNQSAIDYRSAAALNEYVIFAEAFAEGWKDWSWKSTVNPAAVTPVHQGTTALAAKYDEAWAGLYLHTDETISHRDFDLLRFWINGGSGGEQALRVVLADQDSIFMEESVAVTAPQGEWQLVEISLAELGEPLRISGIAWQDTAGSAQAEFYLDNIAFVDLDLAPTPTPPPLPGPALTVDVQAESHRINPDIYGINHYPEELAQELGLPVRRWGGNATTRYNWQHDTANRASDWFFENIPKKNYNEEALPNGSTTDQFVEQDQRTNTKTMLTMPLIGWTPKSREIACGFSIEQYGPQEKTDKWRPDCGNGIDLNGDPIVGNDPTDTSLAIDPTFVQEWIAYLVARYGTAAEGGVAYYSLDNEPMLWHITHRDVRPEPLGYDELRDRTYAYAAAIKEADPTAQTFGPVLWGWTAYDYSGLDGAGGGQWWNVAPDRKAHGDLPLVVWYLQEMQRYEQEHGERILDYLDLHYYPQSQGIRMGRSGNRERQERRLRTTRSLWDPTYVDESWIDEPVRLIPRMREWVDDYYPGTKLAITEYNWGALDHLNGALAQADVLGIFGREGLDLATLWAAPEEMAPYFYAFRIYLNYDGEGSSFGDISLSAQSAEEGQVAIYAARRGSDQAITLVVINKSTQTFTSPLALQGLNDDMMAELYQYNIDNLTEIVRLPDQPVKQSTMNLFLPRESIQLVVLPATASRGE